MEREGREKEAVGESQREIGREREGVYREMGGMFSLRNSLPQKNEFCLIGQAQ